MILILRPAIPTILLQCKTANYSDRARLKKLSALWCWNPSMALCLKCRMLRASASPLISCKICGMENDVGKALSALI